MSDLDYSAMLEVAKAEARKGLAEGGIPIGAAIFDPSGKLIGAGHNRRVQNGDPSLHGETDAFRNAGRQRSYRRQHQQPFAGSADPAEVFSFGESLDVS